MRLDAPWPGQSCCPPPFNCLKAADTMRVLFPTNQRAHKAETRAIAMSGILGFLLVPNNSRWTENQACWPPEVFLILSPQGSFFNSWGKGKYTLSYS